ncbi:hypothetical protein ACH9L7_13805 [Haloferax sp. S1W]|uniref:hypothetical protein n=1 Tax=Haloferax sp. S1W TaxID=3377110 RepID=UPI0037C5B391
MNDPRPVSSDAPLSCYTCGHSYWYVGEEPHDGTCPNCGSRGVSPAGQLKIVNSQPFDTEGDTSGVQLVGRDDSGRLFQYWLRTDEDGETVCTRIDICGSQIGGKRSGARQGALPAEFFPSAVRDAAEAAGFPIRKRRHDE